MPQTEVVFFAESDGSCPLIDWLDELSRKWRSAITSVATTFGGRSAGAEPGRFEILSTARGQRSLSSFWVPRERQARLLERAQDKCMARIERLAECGHELRRPEADTLRDGIYELRASCRRQHHRILYFFHEGRVVLFQGVTKESIAPDREIKRAIEAEPRSRPHERHTYRD